MVIATTVLVVYRLIGHFSLISGFSIFGTIFLSLLDYVIVFLKFIYFL